MQEQCLKYIKIKKIHINLFNDFGSQDEIKLQRKMHLTFNNLDLYLLFYIFVIFKKMGFSNLRPH